MPVRRISRICTLSAAAALALATLTFGTRAVAVAAAPPGGAATTRPAPTTLPSDKPITTDGSAAGNALRKWWTEGSAAGNVGDWYDNRDRGHSLLNIRAYPQLQMVVYTDADRQARRDWAGQQHVLPLVVFGNSSTAAGVADGGSNMRFFYTMPKGVDFLYAEYLHNNLYIYPEHRDYKPGHNGAIINGMPGFGDLFPTNTPFVITSRGSSGSDVPFMQALPLTLAAFRPEVKQKLVETGLLMPTVQMILRRTGKQLADPATEYITGKAHPPAFDGAWVDAAKMVELAHEIQLNNIPPMVQLKVVEEDRPVEGRDFFDPGFTERLADTPAVIARIFRGAASTRRMVVSAEPSYDINKLPLTYTWVVLRGDAKRIAIKPRNKDGSVVEITVPYHERYAVEDGAIETNRVDLGVFVKNGKYHSAPGFITWFFLDDEARTYDPAGKILEIGYSLGHSDLAITNWLGLMKLIAADSGGAGTNPGAGAPAGGATDLLRTLFNDDELKAIADAAREYQPAETALNEVNALIAKTTGPVKTAEEAFKAAEARVVAARAANQTAPTDQTRAQLAEAETAFKTAEADRKKAEGMAFDARLGLDGARKAANDILTKKRGGSPGGVMALLENRLRGATEDPAFYADHAKALGELYRAANPGLKSAVDSARKKLVMMGVIAAQSEEFMLQPLMQGDGPPAARLTRYERSQVQRFQAEVLTDLLTGNTVAAAYRPYYVDPRLSSDKKTWRDVYHYNDRGRLTGWTRYDVDGVREFDALGDPATVRRAPGATPAPGK